MKKRLDVLVTERGISESREKAKAVIMAGEIFVNNQKADKAGQAYDEDVNIEFRGKKLRYVSRGGASTGGFTDCMLQNGAKKVYSIDVGYGQLAWKLRNDERVVNMERTNMRNVTQEQIKDKIDFFSIDVSFISLKLLLPVAYTLLSDNAEAVCLIKPQFEAGRGKVGKKGVVRDSEVHTEVVESIYNFCLENGFSVLGLDFSPIKGPEGNIEYLIYLKKSDTPESFVNITPEGLVKKSHEELDR